MADQRYIVDETGVRDLLKSLAVSEYADNQLPILDENDNFTGQYYDKRQGAPEGQPAAPKMTAHLDYMRSKGLLSGKGYRGKVGQPIFGLDTTEYYESQGIGDYVSNSLKLAANQSLEGLIYQGATGEQVYDLEGFQPNRVERIAGEVLSFVLSPSTWVTTIAGGGAGGLITKKIGQSFLTKQLVKKGLGKTAAKASAAKILGKEGATTIFEKEALGALQSEAATLAGRMISRVPASAGGLAGYEALATPLIKGIERGEFEFGDFVQDATKGLAHGAVLGGTIGAAASFIPGTGIGSEIGRFASEVAVFGSSAPVVEGRLPTWDDYIHAAEFLAAMKLMHKVGGKAAGKYNARAIKIAAADIRRKVQNQGKDYNQVVEESIIERMENRPVEEATGFTEAEMNATLKQVKIDASESRQKVEAEQVEKSKKIYKGKKEKKALNQAIFGELNHNVSVGVVKKGNKGRTNISVERATTIEEIGAIVEYAQANNQTVTFTKGFEKNHPELVNRMIKGGAVDPAKRLKGKLRLLTNEERGIETPADVAKPVEIEPVDTGKGTRKFIVNEKNKADLEQMKADWEQSGLVDSNKLPILEDRTAEGVQHGTTAFHGGGSSTPPYWRNKGYSPKEMVNILDKALRGEKLTEGQRQKLNQSYKEFAEYRREYFREQPESAGELELKVGDEMKVGGEWLRVIDNKDGTLTIQDGKKFKIDEVFDEIPVDRNKTGEPIIRRQVPEEKSRVEKVKEGLDEPVVDTKVTEVERATTPEGGVDAILKILKKTKDELTDRSKKARKKGEIDVGAEDHVDLIESIEGAVKGKDRREAVAEVEKILAEAKEELSELREEAQLEADSGRIRDLKSSEVEIASAERGIAVIKSVVDELVRINRGDLVKQSKTPETAPKKRGDVSVDKVVSGEKKKTDYHVETGNEGAKGFVNGFVEGNTLVISSAEVPQPMRRKGVFTKLFKDIVKKAKKDHPNLEFVEGTILSDEALGARKKFKTTTEVGKQGDKPTLRTRVDEILGDLYLSDKAQTRAEKAIDAKAKEKMAEVDDIIEKSKPTKDDPHGLGGLRRPDPRVGFDEAMKAQERAEQASVRTLGQKAKDNFAEMRRWASDLGEFLKPLEKRLRSIESKLIMRLARSADFRRASMHEALNLEAKRLSRFVDPKTGKTLDLETMSKKQGQELSKQILANDPAWREYFNNMRDWYIKAARNTGDKRTDNEIFPFRENYLPRQLITKISDMLRDEVRAATLFLRENEASNPDVALRAALEAKERRRRGQKKVFDLEGFEGQSVLLTALEYMEKNDSSVKNLKDALVKLEKDLMGDRLFIEGSPEKARGLILPSQWFETDARVIIPNYNKVMSRRIAEITAFGSKGEIARELLKKLEAKDPREHDIAMKGLTMWSGAYYIKNNIPGRLNKLFDWWTALQVGTKIGLGRGTMLNFSQFIISFMPQLGVWNASRGFFDALSKEKRLGVKRQGVVDVLDQNAIAALTGEVPGGAAGKFAHFTTKWSGFTAINRFNLYWSALTYQRAVQQWIPQARGTGKLAELRRKQLQDFGVDYKKDYNEVQLAEGMYKFATDSQLQKNIWKEPLIFNDKRVRPLFLFKRFGYRQATWMYDMLKTEIKRGNVAPVARLLFAGIAGGAGINWAMGNLKSMLSGEEQYEIDDGIMESALRNLSVIGAFGVTSDFLELENLSTLARKAKFAVYPVVLADAERVMETWTQTMRDWERYGDGWLATKRNTYRLAGFLGSYPSYASQRIKTAGQKERRLLLKKRDAKKGIFDLILNGDAKRAGDKIAEWNRKFPASPFGVHDLSMGEVVKYLKRQIENKIAIDETRGTPEFKKKVAEAQRSPEFLDKVKQLKEKFNQGK